MPENKFNLYKWPKITGLYQPVDYGNIKPFDTSIIQNTMQSVTDTLHAAGFKTKEEEQKELEDNIKAMQERTVGLSDADSATDWYHAMETDPEKRAEWDRQADAVTGHGIGTIGTILSAGTIGWLPSLFSTGTGYAGGYGGYKLGEAIDKKYNTNTAPWLSFIGGAAGGIGGYKGLVKLGSKGWLPTATRGNIYGPQFQGDVVSDYLDNSKFDYKQWLDGEMYKSWDDLVTTKDYSPKVFEKVPTKSTWAEQFKNGESAERFEKQFGPLKSSEEFLKDYPDYMEKVGLDMMLGPIKRVRPGSGMVYPQDILDISNSDFGRYVETPTGAYYLGPRIKTKYNNTLVHQGDNPIIDGRIMVPIPSKHPKEPTAIWWEQNQSFFGPSDKTFIINDLIPTTSAREKTGWGNITSVLSDSVDLSKPYLKTRSIRLSPTDKLAVEPPFVFPKRLTVPKVPTYKLFDENDLSAWRNYVRSSIYFKQGGSLPELKTSTHARK